MYIEIPQYIDERFVNNLFGIDLPDRNKEEIMSIDLLGKDLFHDHVIPGNLVCKLLAGRYYESMKEFENSVYSYSKASKSAIELRFLRVASKCCGKIISIDDGSLSISTISPNQLKRIREERFYAEKRAGQIKKRNWENLEIRPHYLDSKTRKILEEIFNGINQ